MTDVEERPQLAIKDFISSYFIPQNTKMKMPCHDKDALTHPSGGCTHHVGLLSC